MKLTVVCVLLIGTCCDVISAGIMMSPTAGSSATTRFTNGPVVAPETTRTKATLFIPTVTAETSGPKVQLSIFQDTKPVPDIDLTGPNTTDFIGEFESALTDSQRTMVAYRSGASRGETLRLTNNDQGREFQITLCARNPRETDTVFFQVQDIQFSNDGPSDMIFLSLNGQPLGDASTGDDYRGGDAWNVVKGTGRIGPVKELKTGDHTLTVRVDTDQWGVELDTITIRVKGQTETELFMCRASLV